MKVLVACEESQVVCKAFRLRGHEAYSCDILPTSGENPNWHFQEDVRNVLYTIRWDIIIAFPPCTDLAVSGARWFEEKRKSGAQQRSIEFFKIFTDLPRIPKVCIENPIGIMSTYYRKPDQVVQPWWFGHGETKATCLWLKGLPKLNATNIVPGREGRIYKMPPSEDRAKLRSKTYEGLAKAMADQWNFI